MTHIQDQILIARINRHPELKNRFESLLDIVENTGGDCIKADDAEQHVIDELRKMGNAALHGWAGVAAVSSAAQLRGEEEGLEGNGKKKSAGTPLLAK